MVGGKHERTRALDGVFGKGLDDGRLVLLSVDELVVQDLDARVVASELSDLVGNGRGVGKRGNGLSNVAKAESHVLGVATAELSLALLTENNKLKRVGVGRELSADETRKTRVDTTTESLVGRADNQKSLALALENLGLGLLKDLVGRLSVRAGRGHGTLSAGELGRGNNLHRLGDLLNVANRLETALDFTESCKVGGIGDLRSIVITTNQYNVLLAHRKGVEGKAVSACTGVPEGGNTSRSGGTNDARQHGQSGYESGEMDEEGGSEMATASVQSFLLSLCVAHCRDRQASVSHPRQDPPDRSCLHSRATSRAKEGTNESS
jgi:hypothetical protein